MSNIAVLPRMCAIAVAVGVALAGCTQNVSGSAVKGTAPAGADKPLQESSLDDILLSVDDVSDIVGGTGLEVGNSTQDLVDNSQDIDKPECLGAFYAAEQQVYEGSGWKAVRDQIIREPGDSKEHWVEQTLVLFANADKALNFFDKSRDSWKKCQQTSVTIQGSNSTSYDWDFGRVQNPSEAMISIDADQKDSNGWVCQHAMSVVSNLIVEAFACGNGVGDQGRQLVEKIVSNAKAK